MKQTLILLHGALGSAQQFVALKERLAEDFDVHTLNFDGHGGKALEVEYSIEHFSHNLLDYLEEHEITTAHIFGYSMGGYVALNAALKKPEAIAKIITLGTKFDWTEEAAAKEVKMLNPEKVEEKVPVFAEKLKQEHAPQDWKLVMTKTAAMMLNMGKGARLMDEDFTRIQHEVKLGWASLDHMVSREETEKIANLLPHATVEVIEGAKHLLESVDLEVLVKFIKDF
ncbi:Pimeloyl-ACP methyl ester carboxylesterase [Lishizhenia tianjinensis]|uniref:Pimeloyl-ACP methyl ester carboxylesterase n=1 Tax=Lishizhenia tianjinensis TaxID=477690 RepID=A0A1I7B512_9FLAO|nr:alpha/beta hydrolase [Lishizhenia tianjinensis]SFT82194.1 Pimeloyl-ACP methyl ester carboxylesterase [Lishizhenia tianjinensis]